MSKTNDNKSVARVRPDVDLDQTMRGTWFGTKVRVEATKDASLYRKIQKIIETEQKLAQERDWPEVPISNVVEMILRKASGPTTPSGAWYRSLPNNWSVLPGQNPSMILPRALRVARPRN